MPKRITKQAANASTENLLKVDEDEGSVTVNTLDKMEAGETLKK